MKSYLLIFGLLLGAVSSWGQSHVSDLVVTPPFSGGTIKWYTASSGANQIASPSTTVLVNGTTYYASQTVNGVESATRKAVLAWVYSNFNAGAIATTGETICSGGDPGSIGSSSTASGGNGTITYQWRSSVNGNFTDAVVLSGSNAATYDPPSGLTTTTSYRRYANDVTCNPAPTQSTGTWVVTVNAITAAPVISSPICHGATVVSGTSESGASVEVYKNGNYITTVTASGTSWTANTAALYPEELITAKATSSGKCQSVASNAEVVKYLTDAPVVSSPIKIGATSISGTCASSNASVDIYVDGNYKTTVTANGNAWTASVAALSALQLVTAKATAPSRCISEVSNTVSVLAIGDTYQGGIVTYIFQPGDGLYVPGETHGTIVATTDQSSGVVWSLPANQSTVVPSGTSAAVGTGKINTPRIIQQNGDGTYAAKVASAYNGGGYNDWYLPSESDLWELYIYKDVIGLSLSGTYFSSTEAWANVATQVSVFNFDVPQMQYHLKSYVRKVRAFRSF